MLDLRPYKFKEVPCQSKGNKGVSTGKREGIVETKVVRGRPVLGQGFKSNPRLTVGNTKFLNYDRGSASTGCIHSTRVNWI